MIPLNALVPGLGPVPRIGRPYLAATNALVPVWGAVIRRALNILNLEEIIL
jgi:hypothetical protein